ncbi:MAG: alpha/beta hydrolase-fold protein [Candidatus Korobacteraceae bacterium]
MGESESPANMYSLREARELSLRIYFPNVCDQLVLRTDLDWEKDVFPVAIDRKDSFAEFKLETTHPFLYLKPCLLTASGLSWASGANVLVVSTRQEALDLYPSFHCLDQGRILDIITLESKILNREHRLRVYLPAGYDENTCRKFPVMYMQDGRNLFFPQDAFLGQDWGVEDKLALLNGMNAIEQMIVVGIFSADRMQEYTNPGYESYGRSVVEEIKPYIDSHFRTRPGRRATGVMGSSLGGVVSFYMGWQWPEVFGGVGCLSSTFTHKDNLVERVLSEHRRDVRFYIDTGWPGDNYEVGLAMAVALAERGYRYGHDFLYFAFPNAGHSERDWGQRLHLPFQFFAGRPAVISRFKEVGIKEMRPK